MAGRHSANGKPSYLTGRKEDYAPRHRDERTAPIGPHSFGMRMGQPQASAPSVSGRARAVKPGLIGPVRHGGQKPVGTVKGDRMGYQAQHSRSVASQTKRDRATRNKSREKANNAVGVLRAIWAWGK